MAASQNGWPAIADYGDPALISNPTVPGTTVQLLGGVRRGPAGLVLLEVARRWDTSVEPLIAGDCWGYQSRPIRGSATVSNHSSGTAVDLNAPAHPIGTEPAATLSPAQIAAARSIVTWAGGLVRWGGNYTGRKDTMHYEIVCSPTDTRLAALAASITATPTPEEIDMAGIADITKRLDRIESALHAPARGVVDQNGNPSTAAADILAALLRQSQTNYNQGNVLKGAVVAAAREAGITAAEADKIAAAVAKKIGTAL